jgi:hypothetical protein
MAFVGVFCSEFQISESLVYHCINQPVFGACTEAKEALVLMGSIFLREGPVRDNEQGRALARQQAPRRKGSLRLVARIIISRG